MGAAPWEEAELRRWRDAYRARSAAGGAECPPPEEVASLVVGDSQGGERERLADHLTTCGRCAADYRDLRELHREASGLRPGGARRRLAAWSAVAAMALVAFGLAMLWRAQAPSRLETPVAETLRGGVDEAFPSAGVTVAAAPPELRWPGQPGATGYRVRLFDERGESLWESASGSATRQSLPAPVRERLASGSGYFWTVEVAGPVARERLGPHWFRIAPAP
jgi:hypothetical protein